MKQFTSATTVDRNINCVYNFLDDSADMYVLVDEHIISHEAVLRTENRVGSVYKQVKKEGSKNITIEMTTVEYEETAYSFHIHNTYTLDKLFEYNIHYIVSLISDTKTELTYIISCQPLTFMAKLIMLLPGLITQKEFDLQISKIKSIIEERNPLEE